MRIIVVVFEQGTKLLLILNRIFVSINRGQQVFDSDILINRGIIIRHGNVSSEYIVSR